MYFCWDPRKSRINRTKHGISFATAALIFQDPHILTVLDERFSEEERWFSLGRVSTTVLYIAHTVEEDENGEEIFRIISARQATPGETRRYYADQASG